MSQEILDSIKKNSGITIDESTNAFDISRTQELLGHLIDEKYNSSLAYAISNVMPLSSSWGTVYASKKKLYSADFEIVKKDLYTKLYRLKTGYTNEVLQDINSMFGDSAKEKVGKILSGISSEDENFELIKMIDNESSVQPEAIIDSTQSGWVTAQLAQRVAKSVVEMNKNVFRTLDSFCILPAKWATYFLGSNYYNNLDPEEIKSKGTWFVGRYGRTDFYINPVNNGLNAFNTDYADDYANGGADINYCYVGLRSDITEYNSVFFAPYKYEIQDITDPDTGNSELYVYNRYSMTTNPLHVPLENNSMLHKFIITQG